MSATKIVHIVGARPQFIKYLPVSRALGEYNKSSGARIDNILVHTGQHYDYKMSDIFFNELEIENPQYYLDVGSGSHGSQTAQVLHKVEEVLLKEKPDALIAYGDTNTTIGAALAAVKLHIPLVHVEAGLRSFNKYMPEEINRILTDHSSSLLLCPTESAVANLRKEGFAAIVNDGKLINRDFDFSSYEANLLKPLVCHVGDVMYDVLLSAVEVAGMRSVVLDKLDLNEKHYAVLTLHRAENTEYTGKLEEIVDFVNNVSAGIPVIFPVHPRTTRAFETTRKRFADNIKMVEPLGYFDMLWLLKHSALAFTDSGGLQKEAYWLQVPCITLRDQTEWVETVQSGWNVLYKDYKGDHAPSKGDAAIYGDGDSAVKIVSAVMNTIDKEKK